MNFECNAGSETCNDRVTDVGTAWDTPVLLSELAAIKPVSAVEPSSKLAESKTTRILPTLALTDSSKSGSEKQSNSPERNPFTRKVVTGDIEIKDHQGRLAEIKHADSSVTRYGYDGSSNLKTMVEINKAGIITSTTEFKPSGIISRKTICAGDSGKVLAISTVEYESQGKVPRLTTLYAIRETRFSSESGRPNASTEVFYNTDGSKRFERRSVTVPGGRTELDIKFASNNKVAQENKYTYDKTGKVLDQACETFDTLDAGKVRLTSESTNINGHRKLDFDASGKQIAETTYNHDQKTGQLLSTLKRFSDNKTEETIMRTDSLGTFPESVTSKSTAGRVTSRIDFDTNGRTKTFTEFKEDDSRTITKFERDRNTDEFRKESVKSLRQDGTVESTTQYKYNDINGADGHRHTQHVLTVKSSFSSNGGMTREQDLDPEGKIRAERRYQGEPNSAKNVNVLLSETNYDREGKISAKTVYAPDGKTEVFKQYRDHSGVRTITNTPDGQHKVDTERDSDGRRRFEITYHPDGKTQASFSHYHRGLRETETFQSPDGKTLCTIHYNDLAKSLEQHGNKIPPEVKVRILKESMERLLDPTPPFFVNRTRELQGLEMLAKSLKNLTADQSKQIVGLLQNALSISVPPLTSKLQQTDSARYVNSLEVGAALARFISPEQVNRIARSANRETVRAQEAGSGKEQQQLLDRATSFTSATGKLLLKVMTDAEDPQARQAAFERFCRDKSSANQYGKIEYSVKDSLKTFMEKGQGDLANWKVLTDSGYTIGTPVPVAVLFKMTGLVGSDAELTILAEMAIKNHKSEAAVRQILTNAATYNALPEALRKGVIDGLFPTQAEKESNAQQIKNGGSEIDLRQLAIQMANGKLDASTNWFLRRDLDKTLKNSIATFQTGADGLENEAKNIHAVLERKLKEIGVPKHVSLAGYLGSACRLDKINLSDEKIGVEHRQKMDILEVPHLHELIQRKTAEAQLLRSCSGQLQLALDAGEESRLRSAGNIKAADRKALDMWQNYGDSLREQLPDLWHELQSSTGQMDSGHSVDTFSTHTIWDRLKDAGLVRGNGARSQEFGTSQNYKVALETLGRPSGAGPEAQVERREALRAIDNHPAMTRINEYAKTAGEDLARLQALYQAAQRGHVSPPTIAELHALAGKITMTFSQGKNNLDEFRQLKQDLEKASHQAYQNNDIKLWSALNQRASAIEQMVNMFDPDYARKSGAAVDNYGQMKHMLKTIWDGGVKESNGITWLATQGTVIAGAIAVCGLAVLSIGSGGILAPAAIGAAAMFIGSEGAKEFQHAYGGIIPADQRSVLGAYFASVQVYDPATGKSRDRTLFTDVICPSAAQLSFDFVITLLTAGVGSVAGKGLGKLLEQAGMKQIPRIIEQNAAAIQKLARQVQTAEKLAQTPAQKAFVSELLDNAMSKYGKELGRQTVGAAEFEIAQRSAAEMMPKAMAKYGEALSIAVMCLLATRHGIKQHLLGDLHGVILKGADGKHLSHGELTFFKERLETQGQRVIQKDGLLEITAPDGTRVFMGNEFAVRQAAAAMQQKPRPAERHIASAPEYESGTTNGAKAADRVIANNDVQLYSPDRRITRVQLSDSVALMRELQGHTGRLFEPKIIETLSKELTQLAQSWPSNLSPRERALQVQEHLNKFADQHGLPHLEVKAERNLPSGEAQYLDGRISIKESALTDGNNIPKLVEKAYHEFVHNEQDGTIVRGLADELKILRLTGIEARDNAAIAKLQKLYYERTDMQLSNEHAREVLKVRNGEWLTHTERARAELLAKQFRDNSPVSMDMWRQTGKDFGETQTELNRLKSSARTETTLAQEKLLVDRLNEINAIRKRAYDAYMHGPEKESWIAGQRARIFALGEGATEGTVKQPKASTRPSGTAEASVDGAKALHNFPDKTKAPERNPQFRTDIATLERESTNNFTRNIEVPKSADHVQQTIFVVAQRFLTQGQPGGKPSLKEQGWWLFQSEKDSPADHAKMDYVMVNEKTGEYHILDASAQDKHLKSIIRQRSIIKWKHGNGNEIEGNSVLTADGEKQVRTKIMELAALESPLNLKDHPIPSTKRIEDSTEHALKLENYMRALARSTNPDVLKYASDVRGSVVYAKAAERMAKPEMKPVKEAFEAECDACLKEVLLELKNGKRLDTSFETAEMTIDVTSERLILQTEGTRFTWPLTEAKWEKLRLDMLNRDTKGLNRDQSEKIGERYVKSKDIPVTELVKAVAAKLSKMDSDKIFGRTKPVENKPVEIKPVASKPVATKPAEIEKTAPSLVKTTLDDICKQYEISAPLDGRSYSRDVHDALQETVTKLENEFKINGQNKAAIDEAKKLLVAYRQDYPEGVRRVNDLLRGRE